MLKVLFTVDVEIWCEGWTDIDTRFESAYQSYIHGPTAHGSFGLPFQLEVLRNHGLQGVFFVEPLYAARFGLDSLAETVALIRNAGQEVQLHLHTEWADEAREPLLPGLLSKRQHLRHFSAQEQRTLIDAGRTLLTRAGAPQPNAFRAGSFGFNRDTLHALHALGIGVDSSYNASQFGLDSGVWDGTPVVEPIVCEGVTEVPMTVFHDGTGRLRHAQLTACSATELEGLLWRALEDRREVFVLLSHGTELLNPAKNRRDDVAVARFRRLCRFLERHRDCFSTVGFRGLTLSAAATPRARPMSSPLWRTGWRVLEQAYRRRYA